MNRKLKLLTVFAVLLLSASTVLGMTCSAAVFKSYSYNSKKEAEEAPDAAAFVNAWGDGKNDTFSLSSPQDLFVTADGKFYIADTGNNRIVICDADGKFLGEIKGASVGGAFSAFASPEGVFVDADGTVCVADSGNARLVFLNPDGSSRVVGAPVSELLPKTFEFYPQKVVLDEYGQIFVISKGFNMGVLQLKPDGSFSTTMGAPSVTVSPLELLWRKFSTKEQKERTESYVPTEYNNISVDGSGFVYVTTSAYEYAEYESGNIFPLQRLNSKGNDILIRQGDPSGDYEDVSAGATYVGASAITDTCVLDNGGYAILDQRRGRVFTYNASGELMYVFGGPGDFTDGFSGATSLVYRNGKFYVSDGQKNTVSIFEINEYGKIFHEILRVQLAQDYLAEKKLWEELDKRNPGLDIVYRGLGDAAYREQDMRTAMKYYRMAGDVTNYSKIFTFVRREWIEKNAVWLVLIVAAIVAALIIWQKLKKRYLAREDAKPTLKALNYANYVCFHPLDGFWDLKREKRGNLTAAIILVALTCLTRVATGTCTGFIFSSGDVTKYNFLLEIGKLLLLIFVWCISLWCVTSLMDGKGTFRDIFIATAYSTMPYIKLNLVAVILSRFMLQNEVEFYNIFIAGALIWTGMLIISGVKQTHDYSMLKTIVVIVIVLIVILLMAFIAMLVVALSQQFYTFVAAIINELALRI